MTERDRRIDLESAVRRAQDGDREALEVVVGEIQTPIHNLAVRMLWHPHDAEDATQEILVRIVTRLGSFRGESAFETWAWRVAANHLLTMRASRAERTALSFEEFGEDLGRGLSDGDLGRYPAGEQALLVEEVKIGCTLGMLLCLDRPHRLAYVLGEVFELTSKEGGAVLELTPAAFRKRLSRARARLRSFMSSHCGLVDADNACRCARRVEAAVRRERVVPGQYLFATPESAGRPGRVRRAVDEMDELHRSAAVYREHPSWATPDRVAETVRSVLDSGKFDTLLDDSTPGLWECGGQDGRAHPSDA